MSRHIENDAIDNFCREMGIIIAKERVERRETIAAASSRANVSTTTLRRFEAGMPIIISYVINILDSFGYELKVCKKENKRL